MKKVQVFGSGCHNCQVTAQRMSEVADELGVAIELEKVTDLQAIMQAGVMSTPGVAIDGVVCHTGSVPDAEQVKSLLAD